MDYERARQQLKGELRRYVESITRKSKSGQYVCPLCGSGLGPDESGAFGIYSKGKKWKCHSCEEGGDIFDLIGKYEGIPDHPEQLKRAGELFGVKIDSSGSGSGARETVRTENQNQSRNEQHTHTDIHTTVYTKTEEEETMTDFSSFFLQAHNHIKETDYPQRRGLSQETIDRFKLGYVAEWRHPKAPETVPTSPRLIIPVSKYSYLARDIREEIPAEQESYKKSKVKGREKVSWTFNAKALQIAAKPIFLVEGELDALSIIEVGGEAVALGSISNIRSFLELFKAKKPSQPLIIALDNEKEPAKKERIEDAYKELAEELQERSIPFYRRNPAGEYKDASDALQANREAFRQAVEGAENMVDEAKKMLEEEQQRQREKYLSTSAAYHLQGFIEGIADSVNTPCISTGFEKLDEALDGGLYEGLYVVGAMSSLGKTTLITQIADYIAENGRDVLIFSLEMARTEIMAKSISRQTIQIILAANGNRRNAKTTRGITDGKRYENYSEEESDLILDAIRAYREYADHIYISEGIGDIGAKEIRETVEKHIRFTGETPVVIVDYLQILAPADPRATDKQNTDKAVLEMKRLSRDFKTPVICISSFNRSSYGKEEVTMDAFKESGAIEYSSDVLIALKFKRASGNFDENEAKKEYPRHVELVILKNRNGRTGDKIRLEYYTLFNYFKEIQAEDEDGAKI